MVTSLIERIVLIPKGEGKLDIDLYGDLAGILSLAANANRPLDESGLLQDKMVAGAGFEPATFRL